MLAQWLISMALSVVISLGTMEGFLLISKCHNAQRLLSEEQAQVRFLVCFLREILHSAILPAQDCGGLLNQDNPLVPVSGLKDLQLHFRICSSDEHNFTIIPVRFYIHQSESKKGISLSIQHGNKRKEVLVSDLHSFSLAFCSKKPIQSCRPASEIQDWSTIEALEFKLRFHPSSILDNLVFLENHHQWKFRIKVGSIHEIQ